MRCGDAASNSDAGDAGTLAWDAGIETLIPGVRDERRDAGAETLTPDEEEHRNADAEVL